MKTLLIREDLREEFKETGWKEAINFVAARLSETIQKYESESVLVYNYAGDRGVVNYSFPLRLFHYLNASMLDYGICDRAGQEALRDIYGTAVGMDPEDLKNQKLIVYWGVNPFWTNLHGFMLAKRYGLEKWIVDVVKTETAKRSEKFFQIRPNTDVLFALGVAKVIVKNDLYDRESVEKNVYGFEKFVEYLSTIDLNFVARETGIQGEKIEEFAFEYAEKRGVIHIGYGLQRSFMGGEAVRAIAILPALVGHKFGFIYDVNYPSLTQGVLCLHCVWNSGKGWFTQPITLRTLPQSYPDLKALIVRNLPTRLKEHLQKQIFKLFAIPPLPEGRGLLAEVTR